MSRGVLIMSSREAERLCLIKRVLSGDLSQTRAAAVSGVCGRHFRRLQGVVREQGPEGVVSRRRGKPSNRRLPEEVRRRAIDLVCNHYRDFGPTLAHEKLFENHRDEFSKEFSVETLRKWMSEEGFWQGRGRSPARVHQSRERRDRFGDMIQIDGSLHDWFEGRRPPCALIAFINDATSMVTHWRFCETEGTFNYMQCFESHLREHGVPISIYSDRHSTFSINAEEKDTLHGETQMARALRQLGIELILAKMPQAKGRIERLFKTLQDRLVKELRIHRVSTIEQANAFLENYRDVFNRKFSIKVATLRKSSLQEPDLPKQQHPVHGENKKPVLLNARGKGHLVHTPGRRGHHALQGQGSRLPCSCTGQKTA